MNVPQTLRVDSYPSEGGYRTASRDHALRIERRWPRAHAVGVAAFSVPWLAFGALTVFRLLSASAAEPADERRVGWLLVVFLAVLGGSLIYVGVRRWVNVVTFTLAQNQLVAEMGPLPPSSRQVLAVGEIRSVKIRRDGGDACVLVEADDARLIPFGPWMNDYEAEAVARALHARFAR